MKNTNLLCVLLASAAILSNAKCLGQIPAASPEQPAISQVTPSENAHLRIKAFVPGDQLFALQSSPDLVHWRNVGGTAISGQQDVAEIDSPTNSVTFYRMARREGMFRLGPQHRAVSDTEGFTNQPALKWKFKTGAGVFSSPTVVGGIVYVGSLDTNFYAIDAESGTEKWHFQTGGPIRSSAAVVDAAAYVYSRDGFIYALNTANGEQIWKCKIAETNQVKSFDDYEYFDSSPTVVNKVLFIGSGDKRLYSIDARNGQVLWTFPVKNKISSPPAVCNGRVYFGVTDGNFYAVDAATGTNLWKFKTQGNSGNGYPNGDVLHAPVVVDNVVYFGSRDSAVYALETETGKKKWRLAIMGGYNWAANSPAVYNGTLLIGSSITGAIVAIDTATGKQKWQVATYRGLAEYASPTVANGVAFFGIGDVQQPIVAQAFPKVTPGYIEAVDLTTHKELWRYATGGQVWSTPAVVDGVVYVGCLDTYIYALQGSK